MHETDYKIKQNKSPMMKKYMENDKCPRKLVPVCLLEKSSEKYSSREVQQLKSKQGATCLSEEVVENEETKKKDNQGFNHIQSSVSPVTELTLRCFSLSEKYRG